MWETWVRPLGQEDSPGEGNGNPLLPGKFHGQRSLVGYSPRSRMRLSSFTKKTKILYIKELFSRFLLSSGELSINEKTWLMSLNNKWYFIFSNKTEHAPHHQIPEAGMTHSKDLAKEKRNSKDTVLGRWGKRQRWLLQSRQPFAIQLVCECFTFSPFKVTDSSIHQIIHSVNIHLPALEN